MVICLVGWRLSPFHPLASFPGPFWNRVTNLSVAYLTSTGKRHIAVKEYHDRYGTFVRIGPNSLSISSSAAVGPIYANTKCFDKSEAYRLGKVQGDGLFFMRSGKEHHPRRSIWAKAFTRSALEGYWDFLTKRTEGLGAYIEEEASNGATIDLTDLFQRWTYDLMGEVVFGDSSGLEILRDGDPHGFVKCGQMATKMFEILGAVPWLFDILWHFSVTDDIHSLEKYAGGFMSDRVKNAGEARRDLCSHLLGEHDDGKTQLTKETLDVESTFAVQAGSDSAATVLSIAFVYIHSTPGVLERLSDELSKAFPSQDFAPEQAKLASLPYLNAVVDESLRLGTPFPGLPRVTPDGGITLSNTYVPAGTVVSVPAYTQQVSEENFYPFPLQFRPERWLPGGLGDGSVCNRSALMCFSFGPYSCLGRNLAIQEIRLAISQLLLNFSFQFTEDFSAEKFLNGVTNVRSTFFERNLTVKATPK
ncbi:cytochrome P450 [Leucogyrophana mollusca]|uniref:Cytochrome P450 n=1 Tax=Leucogyrophana mollusca TaxID=85980 RepID=A0ACB8AY66_9AGAM|nr:cytochrome P450 [Leucogyrophana mollusca]